MPKEGAAPSVRRDEAIPRRSGPGRGPSLGAIALGAVAVLIYAGYIVAV
jgi:hypothetical protein